MPYKSEAQRRYFNANRDKLEAEGVDVDEWNESSKGKKMPEKAAIEKLARCWKGYEPVPGKAPYSDDSCRPKGSKAKKKDEKKASLIPDFNSVRGLAKLAACENMCSCGQPEDECGCAKQAADDASMLGRLVANSQNFAKKHLNSARDFISSDSDLSRARDYISKNTSVEDLALGLPIAGAGLGALGGNLLHRAANVISPQEDEKERQKSRNLASMVGAGLGARTGIRGLAGVVRSKINNLESSPPVLPTKPDGSTAGSFPASQAESFSGLA